MTPEDAPHPVRSRGGGDVVSFIAFLPLPPDRNPALDSSPPAPRQPRLGKGAHVRARPRNGAHRLQSAFHVTGVDLAGAHWLYFGYPEEVQPWSPKSRSGATAKAFA